MAELVEAHMASDKVLSLRDLHHYYGSDCHDCVGITGYANWSDTSDLGFSLITIDHFAVGVHPLVIAGTKHFYAGFKSINFPSLQGERLFGWIFGVVLGGKTKVIPEVSIYREKGSDHKIIFVGLGLELPNPSQ